MTAVATVSGKPRYGVDAPGVMLGLGGVGSAVIVAGTAIAAIAPGRWRYPGVALIVIGCVPLFFGVLMAVYALIGKRRTRTHLLDQIRWRGDERVLDVGTGGGFLLIGAAQRARRGHVIGIDAWSAKDLSNNSAARTLRNAEIERVVERVEVRTGDARRLAFADGAFDCVVSLLCLHNIADKAGRAVACREIARVLRAGGRVVVGDYVPTHAYAEAFSEAGLVVRQSKAAFGIALSLMWVVVADKPA